MTVINLVSTVEEEYIRYHDGAKEEVRRKGRFCSLNAEKFVLLFQRQGWAISSNTDRGCWFCLSKVWTNRDFKRFGRINISIVATLYLAYLLTMIASHTYIILGIDGYMVVKRDLLKICKVIMYFFCLEK